MEDYERELHGIEDDFHSQFADELEVLAALEGGRGRGRGLSLVAGRGPGLPWRGEGCPGPAAQAAGSATGGGGASGRDGRPEAFAMHLLSCRDRGPVTPQGQGPADV